MLRAHTHTHAAAFYTFPSKCLVSVPDMPILLLFLDAMIKALCIQLTLYIHITNNIISNNYTILFFLLSYILHYIYI